MTDLLPRVRELRHDGLGYRRIGHELGITRQQAERLIKKIEIEELRSRVPATPGNAVSLYDTACRALAQAVQVDEVKAVIPVAAAIRAYAKQAKNRELEANAAILRERAERKLGEKLIEAKAAGQIAEGRPPKEIGSPMEPFRVTLEAADIDKKLSMRAQRKAGIAAQAFDAMVDRMRDDIVSGRRSSDILKAVTTEQKQERRAAREAALAGKILALPDKRYGVILADPAWRFEPRSRETGMDRAADNHYPTTPTGQIMSLDVPSIAAPNSLLELWATAPMLLDALDVMRAWGFEYKTHAIWHKIRPGKARGPGYWFTGEHELLLIGTRGAVPCPAPGDQWRSVVPADVRGHSVKPDWAYEWAEKFFPNLPKVELNARRSRPGWDSWGLDAPAEAAE